MAADLGTWPPEQATVLLEALQEAGLKPEARRTRDGVQVTVADDETDRAHQTLVANMDRIARAARPPAGQERPRRRARPSTTPRQRSNTAESTPLTSERLQRLARPLGLLVVGLLLATIIRPLALPIVVFTVAGVVYLLGRQTQGEDGD